MPAEPNRRVHRAVMFTCAPDGCSVGYDEAPEREIASSLLEEATDWHIALSELEQRNVPTGVVAALSALNEAAAHWVEWLDRKDDRPVTA